eukprot:4438301-Amphidinium_carterae.1
MECPRTRDNLSPRDTSLFQPGFSMATQSHCPWKVRCPRPHSLWLAFQEVKICNTKLKTSFLQGSFSRMVLCLTTSFLHFIAHRVVKHDVHELVIASENAHDMPMQQLIEKESMKSQHSPGFGNRGLAPD